METVRLDIEPLSPSSDTGSFDAQYFNDIEKEIANKLSNEKWEDCSALFSIVQHSSACSMLFMVLLEVNLFVWKRPTERSPLRRDLSPNEKETRRVIRNHPDELGIPLDT